MKSSILTLSFVALVFSIFAQPLSGRHTFKQIIETADAQYALNDYYNAITWYEMAYDEVKSDKNNPEKENIAYKTALCYLQMRDYAKAESKLAAVIKKDKDNSIKNIQLLYAKILKLNSKYDEAIAILEHMSRTATEMDVRKEAELELKGAQFAKDAQIQEMLRIENAGTDVNSGGKETSPFSAKAGELLFISDRKNSVTELDGKTNIYSRIYSAQLSGSSWGAVKALDQVINREDFHHFSVSLSKDANTMYFTRGTLQGEVVAESKIYYSTREKGGWSAANELKGSFSGRVLYPITGELFGNEVLFFSSDMEGTKGGLDLYYATKKSDDTYDFPVNLGEVLNTSGDEITPYYSDGKLYFSSNGLAGMGGYDIFVSIWDGTGWSKPQNMGQGYNSSADDKNFSVDKEGNGFLASNRIGTGKLKGGVGQTCCDDIWIVIKDKIKSSLIAVVLDKNKKPLLGSNIQIIEMTNNQPGTTTTKENDKGHEFESPLTLERSYMLVVKKKGYIPDTSYFNTVGFKKTTNIEKTVVLKAAPKPKPVEEFVTVEINQPIELKNILYDYDKAEIRPESEEELNYLADLLVKYPDMVIELSSHTDARGKDKYNQDLSQRRANSAVKWLTQKRDIKAERLKPVGYGESQLKNNCGNDVECTEEEHQENRRTEFKIIAGPKEITITKREKRVIAPKESKN
ncbi:MAG: OmpA family protein [Saprospiraceae bacterium]